MNGARSEGGRRVTRREITLNVEEHGNGPDD